MSYKTMTGIDVSKHQGTIDWDSLAAQYKAGKIGFVIIRAGYGYSTIDPQFERNYREAAARGIPVGAYWYAYWSKGTPADECKAFLAAVSGKSLAYGIWYDVEYERSITCLTTKARTDKVLQGLAVLAASGRYSGLYASTDMINNRLEYDRLKAYDIWVAQYGSRCTCKLPYGIWQYSSANPLGVPGYGNHLDCDRAYKDYQTITAKGTLALGKLAQPVQPGPGEDKPPRKTYTREIGLATRGDLIKLIEAADKLGLYVTGALTIGPMTDGDDAAIGAQAAELGLEYK